MRNVIIIIARPNAAACAHFQARDPESAALMSKPITAVYRDKRSADRCYDEFRSAGIYDVERRAGHSAECLEDVLMHLIN